MEHHERYRELIFDRSAYGDGTRSEVEAHDRALVRELKRYGVKETPLLWNYVCAVDSALMTVKYVEGMLFGLRAEERPDVPAQKKDRDLALVEALGRVAQRWRTAVKDLEEFLEKTGSPAQMSLPDRMRPIIKQAEGVLEDAIEFESRKQKKGKSPESEE